MASDGSPWQVDPPDNVRALSIVRPTATTATTATKATTVTTGAILFTDMVDSTALRSRLGDERADLLRKQHDELLASAITDHRGVVLRWTGDGVKAGFPTSSDAVSAAVEIQCAVAEYGSSPHAVAVFQVRIGLAVGELTIDEGGDYRGVAVIEAARLEALARPGEIFATDMVRLLGSRRSTVVFEEVGERVLKGLDLPVVVHRVVERSGGSLVALPRWLVADAQLPLVGRQRAVEQFQQLWAKARAGESGLVVVSGLAGMGKTRFVSHCAELAYASGALVLGGSCSSDLGVPYEPFAAAFTAVADVDPTLSAAVSSDAGPLARLFPGTTAESSEAPHPGSLFELFEAVTALVRRLAQARPVLLVLDDLHWATASTVMLLRHLVREVGDHRLLVVAACRFGELDATHPFRELVNGGSATTLDLSSLADADVAQLVTSISPTSPIATVAAVAQLVRQESSGNPFFACELIRHLATRGQLTSAPGDSSAQLVPASIHNVVGQRLAALAQDAHEVLTIGAVIGPTFELDLLSTVAGKSADELLDLLDDSTKAGIVAELGVDQFGFVHAIVRNALLDGLSASRRARAHRRVAEALEARGAEQFDELARHWQLAGEDARSTIHLARSARRDLSALAFEAAKAKFRQVDEILARDSHSELVDRADALLGLAAALRGLVDPTFTQVIVRAGRLARAARNPRLMAEAAALSAWLGVSFFTAEAPDVELIELCEDAIALLDPSDPMRVRILATQASHLTFTPDREPRRLLIEEATLLAAGHNDPGLSFALLYAEFTCLWEPATLDRREQITRDLGRLARASGDTAVEFLSEYFAAYCLVERGELVAARARLAAAAPIAAATRHGYYEFVTERLLLSVDLVLGVAEPQKRVDELHRKFGPTQIDAEGTWLIQTGLVAYHRGALAQIVDSVKAMATGPQSRMWNGALALTLAWAGDEAAAEALLDDSEIPKNYFWLAVTQAHAEVAAHLGRLDHCRRLFDDLEPYRGRVGVTGSGSMCFGLVSRSLGLLALSLGETLTAIELLREAVAHTDRIGAVHDGVVSRRLLATALAAAGDRESAAPLLQAALATASSHSFDREVGLISDLLAV